ncbi:hypothetical protein NDN08_002575 [Rhodosorus marinus]|uniref:Deacetylase sirtuin-type domain-containing protein n=1 Tax=Rhodosorus marinus TaxID=101924 RepID=A0AAV8UWV8_9RHOD|nr:hypothetical protein NDN08_002575 [Rhodosorus marinus]
MIGPERKAYPKRARDSRKHGSLTVDELKALYEKSRGKVIVFTGAGISVSSGVSVFSSKGGLYDRARRKFKVKDGMTLFSDRFYRKRTKEAIQFFAELGLEVRSASPTSTHFSLVDLEASILRHVTLNVDGLLPRAGASIWDPVKNPAGKTIEFHGNLQDTLCVSCGDIQTLSLSDMKKLKAGKDILCGQCSKSLRPKIMLYDDHDGELITPSYVWDVLKADLLEAELVLWVGISFEQSASVSYYRRVLRLAPALKMVVVNPSEEALWNLKSALSEIPGPERLSSVLEESDSFFKALVEGAGPSPNQTPTHKHRKFRRIVTSHSSSSDRSSPSALREQENLN